MVGIIILNYNSSNFSISCILSIEENTNIPYRIYLVDGCSSDNSFEYLSDYFRGRNNITMIKSDINGGYSYGNNLGAVKAIEDGADTILIINPDVIIVNGAIDLMYSALLDDRNLAVVGPRIINPENVDMQFAAKLYNLAGFFCSKKPLAYFKNNYIVNNRYYSFNPKEDYRFNGMVSGCCFMIKATDFKSIGLFDTNIFLYYEEDILAYKLSHINKLTKILSGAIVVHIHSKTVNKTGEAFIRFHRFISSQYVLKRYAGINNFQYFFVSLLHTIPFAFNSLLYKPYRALFPLFLKKTASLFRKGD